MLLGPAAAADVPFPPPPKPLRVDAKLDGDQARFSVRYLVRARVEDDFGIEESYELPDRGLITSAVVSEGGKRHVLPLVAADKAADEFGALWQKAPGRSRQWAVLVESEDDRGTFLVRTATPRLATLVLDVEITAPTCFHRDARYVAVPRDWAPRLAGRLATENIEEHCGDHDSPEMVVWMKLPARSLAVRQGGADRIGTYANRTLVGTSNFVKVELDLAARVSEVPADLVTAIVVDASRSTTREELEAQRDAVVAYLRAAPNSRVQVIEYARTARPLLPSWMVASQAAPRVERALQAMQRKNGSAISEGLREAGRWLDQTSGTRRIVLFTDENLSTREERTDALEDALPANTLVHVVALGGAGFMRDDEAKLAPLAARTKGMSVRGGDSTIDDKDRKQAPDATLLVRPITLDHVRVRTPGWKRIAPELRACPESEDDMVTSLAEGTQCTWWGEGDAVSSPFVVEGFLWGEKVERVLQADLSRSLDVVRELSAMNILDEELQKMAERAARAVNSVWSLFGTWGGDDGYSDRGMIGRAGFGRMCGRCNGEPGGFGFGSGRLGSVPDLETELARIVRTCKPSQTVDVEVETTLEEIVEVDVQAVSSDTRRCVEDALWNAWLVVPGAPARTTTRFTVDPV